MGELLFLSLLLAACGVMLAITFGFPLVQMDLSGGARIFPQLVLVLLAVSIVSRMVIILASGKKERFAFLEIFRGPRLFFIASLFVSIVTIRWLGFMISVSVFLVGSVNFNYWSVKGTLGGAKAIAARSLPMVALVVSLYFIFTKALTVLLPAGFLGV
jgi:hypothetical protein